MNKIFSLLLKFITKISSNILQYDEVADRFNDFYNLNLPNLFKVLCNQWLLIENSNILWEIENNSVKQYPLANSIVFNGQKIQNNYSCQRQNYIYWLDNKKMWK